MQAACRKYQRSFRTTGLTSGLLFAYCLLSASYFSFSQVINNYPAAINLPEPVFTKEYIKQNKIKSIRKNIVDKPDGEIMRDKGLAENFQYDENGNLTRHYFNEITSLVKTETEIPEVVKKGKVVKKSYTKIDYKYQYDTLSTEYSYTSNGYLIMQRRGMGNIYYTTYYEYTGSGHLLRQTICKETNKAAYGEPFKLGVQTIISDEKFEYDELTPVQVKKRFLNDEGKPYKQGILNYSSPPSSGGKLLDESYEFIVGFIRTSASYKYDTEGRILEKTFTDNSSGHVIEKTVYEYDASGNILSDKKFRNGEQTNETIYIYERSSPAGNKLLTGQADRHLKKESVRILRYDYEFYP